MVIIEPPTEVYGAIKELFLCFNLRRIVKLDSLSCSFISISFLTKSFICVNHFIPWFSSIRLNSLKSAGGNLEKKNPLK